MSPETFDGTTILIVVGVVAAVAGIIVLKIRKRR